MNLDKESERYERTTIFRNIEFWKRVGEESFVR